MHGPAHGNLPNHWNRSPDIPGISKFRFREQIVNKNRLGLEVHLSHFTWGKLEEPLHYFTFSSQSASQAVDLRRPFGKRLGSPTVGEFALLGIGEIFTSDYLEFPILFNESVDGKRIVVDLIAVVSLAHGRVLVDVRC